MAAEAPATLAGLGVLIPRPVRGRDTLVAQLQAVGCEPWIKPVMAIIPIANQSLFEHMASSLQAADAVIFVSSHAVDCCLAAFKSLAAVLPGRPAYFAVGRSTAERLQAAGGEVQFPRSDANSEGLLQLPELLDVAGKRVVICRGEGGRDKLRDVLRERGAEVEYLDLYRREPTVLHRDEINELITSGHIQLVVIHSGDILRAFLDCLNTASRNRLGDLLILTPGQRMAEMLRQQGLTNLVVAPNALPQDMVGALVRWYTER